MAVVQKRGEAKIKKRYGWSIPGYSQVTSGQIAHSAAILSVTS